MLPSGIRIDCQPTVGTAEGTELTGNARRALGNALRTSTIGNARRTSTAAGDGAESIGGEKYTCLGNWPIASEITTIIEIPATAANHHLAVPRPGADLAAGGIDGGGAKAASGSSGIGGGGETRPAAVCERLPAILGDRGRDRNSAARISGGSSRSN